MSRTYALPKYLIAFVVVMLLTGCGLKYTIKDPVPSALNLAGSSSKSITLTIVDNRTGTDSKYILGKLGVGAQMGDVAHILTIDNINDPIGYLAQHLENEFASRKMAVSCKVGKVDAQGSVLFVDRYQILNIRATGFSPWESCHIFAGRLLQDGQETSIKAYFYNGKTPIWSMSEIEEPCFNIPTSILIKEVASKINRAAFKMSVTDESITKLVAEIDAVPDKKEYETPYWKVLELGYSNNPKAMEPLKKFAKTNDDFFKSCALSAIGTLGAEEQLDFLKQQYDANTFNARYMAAKSIGDIGTPAALQIVQEMRKEKIYDSEGGLKYCVDLYVK